MRASSSDPEVADPVVDWAADGSGSSDVGFIADLSDGVAGKEGVDRECLCLSVCSWFVLWHFSKTS